MVRHAVEHYITMKKNKVLTQVTTRMDLEHTILIERSQTEKTTYYVIPSL